jgi:hypothetical protein
MRGQSPNIAARAAMIGVRKLRLPLTARLRRQVRRGPRVSARRATSGQGMASGGRPGQRQERGPSFASTEAPKSRDRAPDPDSPFAKLAALKASLEAQGKKP